MCSSDLMKVTVENKKGLEKDIKVFIDKKTINNYMDEKLKMLNLIKMKQKLKKIQIQRKKLEKKQKKDLNLKDIKFTFHSKTHFSSISVFSLVSSSSLSDSTSSTFSSIGSSISSLPSAIFSSSFASTCFESSSLAFSSSSFIFSI